MAQPRLLLIDDEPALADYLASAARTVGFEPVVAARDDEFRERFLTLHPEMVALDLGMPVDGVELTRFLAAQDYSGPVLIVSGFDRRVLESAFRLGETLGRGAQRVLRPALRRLPVRGRERGPGIRRPPGGGRARARCYDRHHLQPAACPTAP